MKALVHNLKEVEQQIADQEVIYERKLTEWQALGESIKELQAAIHDLNKRRAGFIDVILMRVKADDE